MEGDDVWRRKHRTLGAPDRMVRMARTLRREMSLPEGLLWRELRQRPGGYRFRKQHPVGRFSLDFACLSARLAIEIDGISHDMGDQPERDKARDAWLLEHGFTVLRIPASEVLKNINEAVDMISAKCAELAPSSNEEALQ